MMESTLRRKPKRPHQFNRAERAAAAEARRKLFSLHPQWLLRTTVPVGNGSVVTHALWVDNNDTDKEQS